jgi:release factor glutamine methyltransferase
MLQRHLKAELGGPHGGVGARAVHRQVDAATPGDDALSAVREIILQAPAALAAGGWLILEHGHEQGPIVRQLLASSGFTDVFSDRDLAGHERITGGRLPD